MLLVNFTLEKSFMYSTNVHSYFEKGNNYISTYTINLNVLRKFMIVCRATPIAVLDNPGLDHPARNVENIIFPQDN